MTRATERPELRLFGDLTERFARIRTFKLRPHASPENLPPCATGDFVEVTTVEYRWVKNPGARESVATVGVFLPVRSTLDQWLSQEEQRRQYIRAARRKVHVDPAKGLAEPEWVKWRPKTKPAANENVAVETVEVTAEEAA